MKFQLAFLSLLLLFGCQDQGADADYNGKFPTKINNAWEYNSKLIIEHYDSLGNISGKETQDLGSTFITIKKINDYLPGYSNLVLFETFDAATPQNIRKEWYRNSDDGLSLIAYSNAGLSQPVSPKSSGKNKYFTLNDFRESIKSAVLPLLNTFNPSANDSIYYFNPARKVLSYPLIRGIKWVELENPFHRERMVDDVVKLQVNGIKYNCYKIISDLPDYNIKFNDYISLDAGLVKRVIYQDSILVPFNNNQGEHHYGRITQQYILLGKNF